MKEDQEKETQEITLTNKQQQFMKEIIIAREMLQKQVEDLAKREILISTLILDTAGIDSDKIESAQLNEEQTILIVTKK